MEDGKFWFCVYLALLVVFGFIVACFVYSECIDAGYTHDQCVYSLACEMFGG
jgi:hypothetical protein